MTDVVLKIDYALNTVVVTCHAGSAQAACAVIDRMQLPEIVGTIAGDDTIFILTRSESSAKQLISLLESQIWG
jgi:transcriptional regulator of arginine metabolism